MHVSVYVTPASRVGGEFPAPVRFDLRQYGRRFVLAYAEACRARGQAARVVWPRERR